ncbi:MAG: cytochrome c3 family protein [Actinobacteria bacterium]|nr:cytochrome c3 family protein [Actinomycetota bacterium]
MIEFTDLIKSLKDLLNFKNLLDIFRHPELHAKEIPLLLSILSIFTLAIIIYYYISTYRKVGSTSTAEEQLRKNSILFGVSVGLMVVFLYIPTIYLMSSNSCLQCHKKTGNHDAYLEQVHLSVDCRDCHIKIGYSGRIESFFKLTSKIARINFSGTGNQNDTCCVSSANCLSCHSSILYETRISKYIKVSHREIFSMFLDCSECHSFKIEKLPSEPLRIMKKCGYCHDGVKAQNDCGYCHTPVGNPPKFKEDLSDFPKTTIKGPNPVIEDKEPSPSVNVKDF